MALALVLVALSALVGAALFFPRRPPAGDRPVIALSLDRTFWNRLGLSRFTYRRAIWRAGGVPLLLDHDDAGLEEVDLERLKALLGGADGLMLSGGGDVDPRLYGGEIRTGLEVKPERDRFELALVAEAERLKLPILAICRGAQLVNVERGGTLRNLRRNPVLRAAHKRFRGHAVELAPGSRLAEILGAERLPRVVTWHGQAVAEPGEGLIAVGRAADGVIEAIETADRAAPWLVGVQWHPEVSRRDVAQDRLFVAFVEAAERFRAAREMG